MFNKGRYVEIALEEEWLCRLRDLTLQVPPPWSEPAELVDKLMVAWFDRNGTLQFYAHCFVRADGSIAGSGLLDPKLVNVRGVYYSPLGSVAP